MHRYRLQPYKGSNSRYRCPGCNHHQRKTFVRYIDIETEEHLADHVGRCDRISNCGYHYTPKQYFQEVGLPLNAPIVYTRTKKPVAQVRSTSFISADIFEESLKGYESNRFATFLQNLFGTEVTQELIEKYFIGTSKHWPGANVFWQIDTHGSIRSGKIMLYDADTGKRVKQPFNHITWVHSILKPADFNLRQCLFGEHLLKRYPLMPVAVVESEKTAVIASVYLPQFIWLAVGGLANLNEEVCKVLSGRAVCLFPDIKGFDKWNTKSNDLSHLGHFQISELLENNATEAERAEGLDLADYLIRFDYNEWQDIPETESLQIPSGQSEQLAERTEVCKEITRTEEEDCSKPESWSQEIAEIESCFKTASYPLAPLKLNAFTTITDISTFIQSHLATVKSQNGNSTYTAFLHRLIALKQILEEKRV